jgi:integrase
VAVKDIRIHHVEAWLAEKQKPYAHPVHGQTVRWSESTCKLAVDILKLAFKWAIGRGYLTVNPFTLAGADNLVNSAIVHQNKKTPIEAAEHKALLKAALRRPQKDLAILMMMLHGTGARPSELVLATDEEWDDQKKAFVIRADDDANEGRFKLRRLKKDRLVYIRDEILPLVELQREKYRGKPLLNQKGRLVTYLFRKERRPDQPMDEGWFGDWMRKTAADLNEKAGKVIVRPRVVPYSYRHGFVTRSLQANCNIHTLANLLGTSVMMIEKHYSHLFKKHEVLREHLNSLPAI